MLKLKKPIQSSSYIDAVDDLNKCQYLLALVDAALSPNEVERDVREGALFALNDARDILRNALETLEMERPTGSQRCS
jgi:hypothetical protein